MYVLAYYMYLLAYYMYVLAYYMHLLAYYMYVLAYYMYLLAYYMYVLAYYMYVSGVLVVHYSANHWRTALCWGGTCLENPLLISSTWQAGSRCHLGTHYLWNVCLFM